jgi:hypothetical protein
MIKNFLDADEEPIKNPEKETTPATLSIFSLTADEPSVSTGQAGPAPASNGYDLVDWDDAEKFPDDPKPDGPAIIIVPYKPPSKVETIRRSGLAWSAGVIFFGSVGFMLILGWFADLIFGSAPWGIVVGIAAGSVIGFVNFFRITSQIFKG